MQMEIVSEQKLIKEFSQNFVSQRNCLLKQNKNIMGPKWLSKKPHQTPQKPKAKQQKSQKPHQI